MHLNESDLWFTGFGVPWGHTRSYDNIFADGFDGINGINWYATRVPHLLARGGTNPVTLTLVTSAWAALWYDRVGQTDHYAARFHQKSTIIHYPEAQEYVFTDDGGRQMVFFDFTVAGTPGQFKGLITPGGTRALAAYDASFRLTSLLYTAEGGATGFTYVYEAGQDSPGKLASVTLQIAGVPSRRASYGYYGLDDSNGLRWDLLSAAVAEYDPATASWAELRHSHYRYYTANGPHGFAHGLKYLVGPEAYARMEAAGLTPETASDAEVAGYADYFFVYDWRHRVTNEQVQGGAYVYTFSYEENPAPGAGFNAWTTKTTETLPDGSQNIAYSNLHAQVLFKIFRAGAQQWFTALTFDAQGRQLQSAESSAVAGFDESLPGLAILKSDSGLIKIDDYYGPGDPGGQPAGYLWRTKLQQGTGGTPVVLREWTYTSHAVGYDSIYPVASETAYQSTEGDLAPAQTRWTYDDWYAGSFQVKERTRVLPVITEAQNGSGTANQFTEVFDEHGHRTWLRNEREFLTYSNNEPATGSLRQQIEDVNTALLAAPYGWTTPAGGGLHLISDFESDELGRETQSLGPEHQVDLGGTATTIRRAVWTVYQDDRQQTWRGRGYATGGTGSYVYTLIDPVQIAVSDLLGRGIEQIQAVRSSASGRLSATDTLPQTSWCRWQRNSYDNQGRQIWTRTYVSIPPSGEGVPGTNYNETGYGYDVSGIQVQTITPGGTIRRSVLNARGWETGLWVGTNASGATPQDPSGGGTAGNNMVRTVQREFDGGLAGGDGNLSRVTVFAASDDSRVTAYGYDWRNRQITADGEIDFFEATAWDNLDRMVQVDRHDTTADGTLIGRQTTGYDNLGRVYARSRYAVNVTSGAVGNAITELTWYDAAGNAMRVRSMGKRGCNKSSYDALNRVIRSYVATDPASGSYARASSVEQDTVLEQTETTFDHAGNIVFSVERQRFHDATGAGELQGVTGVQPHARVNYQAMYPDPLGRQVVSANFGTHGGSAVIRPTTVPVASDTLLVVRSAYNDRGERFETTDPAARVDRKSFDDAGQELWRVENYSTVGSGSDYNKSTKFDYNSDGRMTALTAVNEVTGNQVTRWVFGTTLADSKLVSNALVRQKIYPDDSVVTYAYDRTSSLTSQIDPNGTKRAFLYDLLGRLTDDCVQTLGPSVDGIVRRISRAYDVRGFVATLTSASDDAPGSGSVINQVQYGFNDFGQKSVEYQAHEGTVDIGSTPMVRYAYADGTNNTNRRTAIIYPNGRVIGYTYGDTDSADDLLNRVTALTEGDADQVHYQYLGVKSFVRVAYVEPGFEMTFVKQSGESNGDAGDQYSGLDPFNRVAEVRWLIPGVAPLVELERVKYGFDRANNRVWRREAISPSVGFDEAYTYDGLYQLATRKRGTHEGGAISSPNQQEEFTYDRTGNWPAYRLRVDGAALLDQTRTHNAANEISGITNLPTTAVSTAYDAVGNMIATPRVGDWTTTQTLVWDAWNRLMTISEGATSIGSYQYDGATRRTVKTTFVGNAPERRHFYYGDKWRVLEERTGPDTSVERQFVWGERAMDDLVLRDRLSDSTDRFYALQDQWSVTAIADESGTVRERYCYLAFGHSQFLTSDFAPLADSRYDWEVRFGGYRHDSESRMFHVRNRYLQPDLGRWLSRDPLGEIDQANLFHAVGNNPVTYTDPSGLDVLWEWLDEDYYFMFSGPNRQGLSKGLQNVVDPKTGLAPVDSVTPSIAVKKIDGKCRCWVDNDVKYDIHIMMHRLKVTKGVIGWGASGPIYASADTITKMYQHEAGHERDFKQLFSETIQKSIDAAKAHKGEANAITANTEQECQDKLRELINWNSNVISFWQQMPKLNKDRDARQNFQMKKGADGKEYVVPNAWSDF